MKIYVINLARATKRRAAITEQLTELKLDFSFVSAIDGHDLSQELQDQYRARLPKSCCRVNHCITAYEIACNLSHIKAWQQIAQAEDQYAVVMEDDAFLAPDCAVYLKDMRWVPQNAQLIKLDYSMKNALFKKGHVLEQDSQYKRIICDILINPYAATAYIIRKDIAKILAEKLSKSTLLVDVFLYDNIYGMANFIKPQQIYPALVKANSAMPSSIVHGMQILSSQGEEGALKKEYLLYRLYCKLSLWRLIFLRDYIYEVITMQ